ncbi:aldehyde dehydrogenase family protein [Mycobacterium sp. 1274756.6]|uniref:aldehyde dehydrogenase family protein n=1 Tax=Mycobacterium sp. 1274756.6 TaxID=1834076 RepID=UPI0007FF25C6|nr:aldehyde dehydrogenase family protein [Mycobacterium sp. 1274756.6]OBJ70766.1 aldehyde dehydrogenase [Mycobacterium sp. 1274756.6]
MATSIPVATAGVAPDARIELQRFFATGTTVEYRWRIDQLRGIGKLLAEQEGPIAEALRSDLGRPPVDAWLGDIASTQAEVDYALKHLKRWMRRRRASVPLSQLPARAWVQYEPLGVVFIIGPWNYPVYLTLAPLIAAVAAGNCAVVKPSELAPATSALLTRLIPEYVDARAVRVVEGDAAVTQELLAQGFDHAFFTGGTEVGRKIMAAAAPTLTPVTLELGGKSPVIVAADADIDVAARRIAWVKLLNSGQTCIAPDYVLAEHAIAAELTAKVIGNLKKFRPDSVPIVNHRQFERLAALIDQTDGEVVTGGHYDRENLRIHPTVVVDPSPEDPMMTAEIFGPILPILTVETVDDAARFINARPKPLGLYVFTKTRGAQRIIDQIPSGGAVVNHIAMHCMVPSLPFGGVGDSGMGAYHGKWGFETFSHRRAVLSKPAKPDSGLVYPPYSPRAVKWLRRMF